MITAYGIIAICLSVVIGFTQVGRRGTMSEFLCLIGIVLMMSGVAAIWFAMIRFAVKHLP